jgi:hypothetical protein
MQPKLFAELEPSTETLQESKAEASKRVVQYLLDVRRRMKTDSERQFIPQINHTLKIIRTQTAFSDAENEKLILHAVEKSQAATFEEISEDTRIAVEVVKQIVLRLKSENILGISYRGKNRMSEFVFSKRQAAN